MKKILFYPVCIAALSLATSCFADDDDYKEFYRETRNLSGFNSIQLSGSADVVFTPADIYEVIVEGEGKDVRDFRTEVKNGSLCLYLPEKKEHWWSGIAHMGRSCHVRIRVAAPGIREISSNGSGDIDVTGSWNVDGSAAISTSGSGDVEIGNVNAASFCFRSAGSGDLDAENVIAAESISIKISGSGDVDFDNIETKTVDISIAGSGDVELNGKTTDVNVSIAGSGDIHGRLEYENLNQHTAGSGRIHFN